MIKKECAYCGAPLTYKENTAECEVCLTMHCSKTFSEDQENQHAAKCVHYTEDLQICHSY
jgi:uncharacterized Zn finger protein (UPF0148 family)